MNVYKILNFFSPAITFTLFMLITDILLGTAKFYIITITILTLITSIGTILETSICPEIAKYELPSSLSMWSGLIIMWIVASYIV